MTIDTISIEIDGGLRFSGARNLGDVAYLPVGSGQQLSLDVPIGVLLEGRDIDLVKDRGEIPVAITRGVRYEMSLAANPEGKGALVVFGDMEFDVRKDSVRSVLSWVCGEAIV